MPPDPGNPAKFTTLGNIHTGRRAGGPGDGRPEHLTSIWLPSHSDARQQDKAGVVIVLELGSDCKEEPVRHEMQFRPG